MYKSQFSTDKPFSLSEVFNLCDISFLMHKIRNSEKEKESSALKFIEGIK
jgi:hypothetical protein